jgi:hypothetical protein
MPWSQESRERAAARMKALNADPEFKAQTAARMKALHADPEFKAQAAARMKALNADPEFKAKIVSGLREKARQMGREIVKAAGLPLAKRWVDRAIELGRTFDLDEAAQLLKAEAMEAKAA